MPIPYFTELINDVISTLKELGGSARPAEVYPYIATKLNLTEEDLNEQKPRGGSLFENRVAWARFFLVKDGFIDSSKYGVWSLTDKGRNTDKLSEVEIRELVRKVQNLAPEKPNKKTKAKKDLESEDLSLFDDKLDYRDKLISLIQSIPPSGFERLCQRILRESGFQQVIVTGRSGDGGIDGIGLLQINPFVSFKVLFQSKRYIGSVSASQVRDFRGAMMGRADKGLIITTGSFSPDAKSEAVRDGVPPIELIDGDELVLLFEKLEIGLMPRTIYEIDESFFDEFKKP